MTWVVPLALGGFAVLLMAVFSVVSARRKHHASVAPAQTVGPRILIHDINDDRCTGCDACVAVCPTNVLDLVANKSRVLRFQDCIQCEACMFACPTEALVMFPEGNLPPPLKVPEIDEFFQTAVPGQYLIGEVAGKPLVKNAANLGRVVVEHMLATGLHPGALGHVENTYDVVIIGSGPGGLSAALSCIQRKLSYIVLEKEQVIASTIARYPKGKLVMAEPYDTMNVSLLPVFDSSKEQLIPIWRELIERVRLRVNQGESVESIQPQGDGTFDVRSTVAAYRAQRVVLSIGTRGKPRTLQVPGENLPKIFSLLDDPDSWAGRNVLVVGGGDSACEAALALSDAGARVIISYRGKGFNRAAPKNKQTIEAYAAEGRIKAKLGSQVLQFEHDSVTLALADGSQKRYPNDGAFVLIGADPPIAWLEKVGVQFVDRPHQYQLGKTDDLVSRFLPIMACPEDAARAAAQVLGGSTGLEPRGVTPPPLFTTNQGPRAMTGPKKWLRSATSLFSNRGSVVTPMPKRPDTTKSGAKKRLDAPVPLSEFAARQNTQHTGHGRRDQLSAGERTRILRMLRDEGGRIADEESQVHVGLVPSDPKYDFDFDDDLAVPAGPPSGQLVAQAPRGDVPARPAVVVGLAQANSARRAKRLTGPPAGSGRSKQPSAPPPIANPRQRHESQAPMPPTIPRSRPASMPPPPMGRTKPPTKSPPMKSPPAQSPPAPTPMFARSAPPPPFGAVDAKSQRARDPRGQSPAGVFDEKTRAVQDPHLVDAVRAAPGPGRAGGLFDEPTRMSAPDRDLVEASQQSGPAFLPAATVLDPHSPFGERTMDELADAAFPDEVLPTIVNHDAQAPAHRGRAKLPPPGPREGDRTRAADARNGDRDDPSMSDIDWDID